MLSKTLFFVKGRQSEMQEKINCTQTLNWIASNCKELNKEGLRTMVLLYQEVSKNITEMYSLNSKKFQALACIGILNNF